MDTLKKHYCLCDLLTEIVHSSRSLGTSTEVDIYKGMCEILIIFNKCLNVGSLELGNNELCTRIVPVMYLLCWI